MKQTLNRPVAQLSVAAGGILWFLCSILYSTCKDQLPGTLLIPILCSVLFAALFLVIWLGSKATGSFDRNSPLYSGTGSMLGHFALCLAGVFCLTMLCEFFYELDPEQQPTEPTSYIFVIDESGSMETNDPDGKRYDAITQIMNASDSSLPYMVYAFAGGTRVVRDMAPQRPDETTIPINTEATGTAIVGAIRNILQDYKSGGWEGGQNPRIIFLTDGYATDLNSRRIFFNHTRQLNRALAEYNSLGITISTVGLGSVDESLLQKMADSTGGVFISVEQAADLASAMEQAALSCSARNLLSTRHMRSTNALYALFRISALSLIGSFIGGSLALAYMNDASIPLIVRSSAVSAILGSILFEVGVQNGGSQSFFWFLLWLLFAATFGYCPRKTRRPSARTNVLSCQNVSGILCQTGGKQMPV